MKGLRSPILVTVLIGAAVLAAAGYQRGVRTSAQESTLVPLSAAETE